MVRMYIYIKCTYDHEEYCMCVRVVGEKSCDRSIQDAIDEANGISLSCEAADEPLLAW
jgi:hypothetical protein